MLNVMQSSFGNMRTPRFCLEGSPPISLPPLEGREGPLSLSTNRGEELGFLTYCQLATDRLYNSVMLRIGTAFILHVVTTYLPG